MPVALTLLLALPAPALAAFPERISILAMDDYAGSSTESIAGDDYVAQGYKQVVLELGSTLANKPLAPARTLGVSGFHVGVANSLSFIQTGSIDGTNPAGWDLADPDEDPMVVLFVPQVQVRKGLPASLEVGANFGWLGLTETGVVGVYGRWGLVEGYRFLPDMNLQVGYAGYVGNDELEMGVLDIGANIGYTLPFGPVAGINLSRFSPFLSLGVNRIHAAPRADLSGSGLDGRVTELTGFEGEGFDPDYAPFAFGGGIELESGDFTLGVSAAYATSGAPTVNTAIGFTY